MKAVALTVGLCGAALYVAVEAQGQAAPRYKYDPIWFLNRDDGKIVGRLGSMGESGGQFFGLHMIATNSRGYICTGEVFAGQRVQRFVPSESPRGTLLEQLSRVQ